MSGTVASKRLKVLEENSLLPKVCVVIGTRPGIIKQSPTVRALQSAGLDFFIIHTGQHYSYEMDAQFFEDLQLPEPLYRLDNVAEYWTHAGQTGEMMKGIEAALLEERPRVVIVGGDANTNLAGALAARKLQLTVGHVEAGLRSGDWRMPEEHNRVMIDHISDFLFAPTEEARENLVADHVRGQIIVTGNTIVDAVNQNVEIAKARSDVIQRFGLQPNQYFVVTAHREETVDVAANLAQLLETIVRLAEVYPGQTLVFPVHPRTAQRFEHFDFKTRLAGLPNLKLVPPVGYFDFLLLMSNATLTLTDSGGVQEEACILGVPCITLRDNTERPETVTIGANRIAGLSAGAVLPAVASALKDSRQWRNPFGDGHAAERIVAAIHDVVGARR